MKPTKWTGRTLLTTPEAAWVACCIDCEGTVCIHVPPNRITGGRNVQCYIRVNMVNEAMPRRLHDLCGGSIHPSGGTSPTRRPQWYWNLSSGGIRWLLPQILPHMIEKRRHAEVLLAVVTGNRRGHPMPADLLLPLLDEIRRLNVKGFRAAPLPVDRTALIGKRRKLTA